MSVRAARRAGTGSSGWSLDGTPKRLKQSASRTPSRPRSRSKESRVSCTAAGRAVCRPWRSDRIGLPAWCRSVRRRQAHTSGRVVPPAMSLPDRSPSELGVAQPLPLVGKSQQTSRAQGINLTCPSTRPRAGWFDPFGRLRPGWRTDVGLRHADGFGSARRRMRSAAVSGPGWGAQWRSSTGRSVQVSTSRVAPPSTHSLKRVRP